MDKKQFRKAIKNYIQGRDDSESVSYEFKTAVPREHQCPGSAIINIMLEEGGVTFADVGGRHARYQVPLECGDIPQIDIAFSTEIDKRAKTVYGRKMSDFEGLVPAWHAMTVYDVRLALEYADTVDPLPEEESDE